ncbi:hypothetical protein [[Eubacterium] cellulosolvens]
MTRSNGLIIRRIFHLLFAFIVIYYYLPATIFGVPTYYLIIILFFLLPVLIEIVRLRRGITFLGLHDHERNHVASYLWFCAGATLLIIAFPQQIAAPCIIATALGDPVIGLTKPYRRRFIFIVTFLICLLVFVLFQYPIYLAILAAGVAFIAESFEFKIRVRLRPNLFWSRSKHRFSKYKSVFDFLFRTDDDFMMQVIPAIVLLILFTILPELLPPQVIYPLQSLMPYA